MSFDGRPAVTIKMKPSSFIIAAIVDPLNFTFLKDTRQIAELVGRTTPKQLGGWKVEGSRRRYHLPLEARTAALTTIRAAIDRPQKTCFLDPEGSVI